jgi:succinoglycan biosynthesis protein ExoM
MTTAGSLDPIPISVCIATYRRPESLRRLLEHVSALTPDTPRFEVVVVDNEGAGSTEPVVAAFAERLTLRHDVEPRRGIAHARNRSVALAAGTFIAFIDDDEIPDRRWLAELHSALVASSADGAFGPVDVRFEDDVPAWVQHCRFFRRPVLATGTEVPWWQTRTGNALIRRSSLPSRLRPFDERFGLTGGEDVDLFFRMIEQGARFIAVESARVVEVRSRRRCTAWWMLKRSFRRGGTIVDVAWRDTRGTARLRASWGAARAAVTDGARALRGLGNPERSFEHVLTATQSLGMVACTLGCRYREYRQPAD